MSRSKYKANRPIRSVAEFEQSECKFFIVFFGTTKRTIHRIFLENWQYRKLAEMIKKRTVFEAGLIEGESNEREQKD